MALCLSRARGAGQAAPVKDTVVRIPPGSGRMSSRRCSVVRSVTRSVRRSVTWSVPPGTAGRSVEPVSTGQDHLLGSTGRTGRHGNCPRKGMREPTGRHLTARAAPEGVRLMIERFSTAFVTIVEAWGAKGGGGVPIGVKVGAALYLGRFRD